MTDTSCLDPGYNLAEDDPTFIEDDLPLVARLAVWALTPILIALVLPVIVMLDVTSSIRARRVLGRR